MFLNYGVLVRQDGPSAAAAASKWLERAAEAGHSRAMELWGRKLSAGGDRSGAILWLTRAAEAGAVNAAFVLGRLYSNGKAKPNFPEAKKWYRWVIEREAGGEFMKQAKRELRKVELRERKASRRSDDVLVPRSKRP